MDIEINGEKYVVKIIKKNNRNTYVRVKNGIIVVTTNYFVSKREIINLINKNKDDIAKMINHDNKSNGDSLFYYFGNKYNVIYGFNDIEFDDDKIYVKDKKYLDKYILNDINKIYSDRLMYWYNVFNEKIPVPRLRIRKMSSRWGVCNIKSYYVTLNYNLCRYPIECLDYVIVHELSHFVYPNHSHDFWSLVEKYYPKYKDCKKLLKE